MNTLNHPSLNYNEVNHYEIKVKTRKEFAFELGYSTSTFYRKLKQVVYKGKTGLLSPKQQTKIKKLLNND